MFLIDSTTSSVTICQPVLLIFFSLDSKTFTSSFQMWSLDFVAIINSKRGSSRFWVSSEGFSFANATILETWLKQKKKTASLKLDNCEKIQYIFFSAMGNQKNTFCVAAMMYSEKKSSEGAAGEPRKVLYILQHDMNFSKQIFSMCSVSVSNMLQVLCNHEDAGHTWGQTFWPTEWNLQRNMEYETVGERRNMEEEKERKEVPSVIQYKGGSEAQTPVEYLITILPWSLAVTWRWFSTIRATGGTLWMNTCLMTPSRTVY